MFSWLNYCIEKNLSTQYLHVWLSGANLSNTNLQNYILMESYIIIAQMKSLIYPSDFLFISKFLRFNARSVSKLLFLDHEESSQP